MKRVFRVLRWGQRPQVLVGLVAVTLCGFAPLAMRSPPAPTATITKNNQPAVQGATYTPPRQPAKPVDCSVTACFVLSFDDGPHPVITPKVLGILKKHQVRATFFVLGRNAQAYPDLVRQIYLDGHEIGNHSWDHRSMDELDPAGVRAQVKLTQQAVMAAGVPAPYLFRPPYGAMNDMVRNHVPLTLALWNVDPEDWNTKDPTTIMQHIRSHAKAGGVADLHDIHDATAEALESVILELKDKYQLVTVGELLNIAPGQRGEFYGR